MAARFLAAGYTVYGESLDPREARDLARQGLRWRDTPREIVQAADVVFTSGKRQRRVGAAARC